MKKSRLERRTFARSYRVPILRAFYGFLEYLLSLPDGAVPDDWHGHLLIADLRLYDYINRLHDRRVKVHYVRLAILGPQHRFKRKASACSC